MSGIFYGSFCISCKLQESIVFKKHLQSKATIPKAHDHHYSQLVVFVLSRILGISSEIVYTLLVGLTMFVVLSS